MNNLEALKTVEGFQRKLRRLKREMTKFQKEADSYYLGLTLKYVFPLEEKKLSLIISRFHQGQKAYDGWNKENDWQDWVIKCRK